MSVVHVVLGAIICVVMFTQPVRAAPQMEENVVYIQVVDKGDVIESRGSGILLNSTGFVMTAKHVLSTYSEQEGDRIEIGLKTKQNLVPGRAFDCEPYNIDLCIIYVTNQHIKAEDISEHFKVACRMPRNQEKILASGYPLGDDSPMISVEGAVSSPNLGEGMRIYMNNSVLPGMSGGPVFDEDDYIIGIVHGGAAPLPLFTFTPTVFGKGLLNKTDASCSDLGDVLAQTAQSPDITSFDTRNTSLQPAVSPVKAYIQYGKDSDREVAETTQKSLRAAGIFAPGTERVSVRSTPNENEIRYFNDVDKAGAEAVGAIVRESTGREFEIKKVGGIRGPVGLVEVWFGLQ